MVIDAAGVVRIRRGKTEVKDPADPEEFRRRLRTLGLAYYYARLKHPGRAYLKSAVPSLWQDYTDYMLGEHVRGLHALDHNGVSVSKPAWAQVLAYDWHVRRDMAKRLNAGASFDEAIRKAWSDTVVRDLYFVTPLAVGGAAMRERPRRSHTPRRRAPKKPQNKGPGQGEKGGGKGKSKRGNGLYAKTPDGRNICFAFNAEGCSKKCGMVHICRKCLGPHPMFQCKGEGTQAGGASARAEA